MRRGMTLLEVLVSMLLLGLMVTGIVATFSVVGKGTGKLGSRELQGMNYARETLEKLKTAVSISPARSASLVDSNPAPDVGTIYNDPTQDVNFERFYEVDDVDVKTGMGEAYKRVTVTVRWFD